MSRGGRSTKTHAVVDGLGYPLVLELTGGQVHDGVMMQNCLEQFDISGSTVLTDKAYGSRKNREYIANRDADFCILPKSNSVDPWHTDFYHYKERHLCFLLIRMNYEKQKQLGGKDEQFRLFVLFVLRKAL
ncbi:MAG: transposase [Oscillospiraceae bacterium]|nr:transposase [Oscillospiraceae bacterium]